MTTPQTATQSAVHDATFAPFEVKAADADARTFEGLAATWEEDLGGDVIHKGAFARTLDHWKAAGGRRVIPLVDNHAYKLKSNPSFRDIVGKLLDAREEKDGLWTRYSVARTAAGDDLLALAKDGMVSALSIGYAVEPGGAETKAGKRHLKALKLAEVSPVIFPMNEGARIDALSVKAIEDAARAGTLTDAQREHLRALLDAAEVKAPPRAFDPEAATALAARIASLTARRLATRVDAVLGPARTGRSPSRP